MSTITIERNSYKVMYETIIVYSETLARNFYGATLSQAQANRDSAERVYYAHHKYDLLPVED